MKATYCLEGDGPLALVVYEEISNLRASISSEYYPNVVAVAKSLTSVSTQVDQLINYALNQCMSILKKSLQRI